MNEPEMKPIVHIPFDVLPEGRSWSVGKSYRVKAVLRQTGVSEDGAMFEIIDATSLEPNDQQKRRFMSDGGYTKS